MGGPRRLSAPPFSCLRLCLVALFLAQVRADRDYLFAVDDSILAAGEPDRDLRIAAQLLADLYGPIWKSQGDAELLRGAKAVPGIGAAVADLEAFGVVQVFGRAYAQVPAPGDASSPRVVVEAVVYDVAVRRRAFGLCAARRSGDAEPVSVGRDGWIGDAGHALGFWAGRYYTELRRARSKAPSRTDDTSAAPTDLPALARELADRQLDDREPFTAEALLTAEGGIEGSFRYVHRDALGLDGLDDAFLVDLTSGVTVWVVEASDARSAEMVIDSVLAAAARQEVGDAREANGETVAQPAPAVRYDGPLRRASFGDGELAVFSVDRFACGAAGRDGDRVAAAANDSFEHILAVTAAETTVGSSLIARCAPPTAGGSAVSSDADYPFPDAGVDGWRSPSRTSHYTAETLYKKINGRADAYLQFGVVGLAFGSYEHEADPSRMIDVYWYDMGKPDNAFGMYRSEMPPDVRSVALGREAYDVGGAVFFCKGASYVQVLPAGALDHEQSASLSIAERIAALIPDDTGDDWALSVLPEDGRIADSLEYHARDVFGLVFLADVFTVRCLRDGTELTLFVHRAESKQGAAVLFDQYVVSFKEYGQVVWEDPDPARKLAAGDVYGAIDIVFASGVYLGGVTGADDLESARGAVMSFYERMEAP